MNTSPTILRHAALLLALATVTGPLVAQRAPSADKPRPARSTSPKPAEAPEPPEPPHPPGAVEDVTVNIAGIEPSVPDGLRQAHIQVTRASRDMQRQFAQMHVGFNGSANTRTLLVPADDASPEQLGRLREELAIMSRIFGKAADPDGGKRSGFRFNFGGFGLGQKNDLDALYLDGYGAIFPLDVDFPLIDAPKVAERKPEPKSDKDATWEKTRRELAGSQEEESEEVDEDAGDSHPAPFDADKVSALRKRLTESFRHAANLKSVKPDEQVVLVVSSQASRSGGRHTGPAKIVRIANISSSSSSAGGGGGNNVQVFGGPENHGGPVRQQLTLRAKKSDVDAFAAGKLNPDEFAKKVRVASREESTAAKP